MSNVENNPDDLVSNLIDVMTTKYVAQSYDQAIDCAIVIKLLSNNDPNPNRRTAALTFIQECAKKLLGAESASAQETTPTPACSFCGRQPPAVRLGAGPAVFICNECVETFAKIL